MTTPSDAAHWHSADADRGVTADTCACANGRHSDNPCTDTHSADSDNGYNYDSHQNSADAPHTDASAADTCACAVNTHNTHSHWYTSGFGYW